VVGDVEERTFVKLDHTSTDWRTVAVVAVRSDVVMLADDGLACAAPGLIVQRVVVESGSLYGQRRCGRGEFLVEQLSGDRVSGHVLVQVQACVDALTKHVAVTVGVELKWT
jgi:hypothetical protein